MWLESLRGCGYPGFDYSLKELGRRTIREDLGKPVGEYLTKLAEGVVSPSEAADWALRAMAQESAETVDPKIWRALDQLASADLLESPGKYLHGWEDFACWRASFENNSDH